MNKVVSIIVPAWNVERYIAESLDSILAQSYTNMEILVIDDGGTDRTKEIAQSYAEKDKRIKVISQANKGLSGARNTGLTHAMGEYVCIFDSDDIMLPDKIKYQVEFLENNPACGLVYSDMYHFFEGSPEVYFWPLPKLSNNTYLDLLRGNFLNPNAVLFRKSIYDMYGGFDEKIRSSEDWEYWLTLSRQGVKFGYLPENLALYRMRKDSLSSNRVRMYETAVYVLEKQKTFLPSQEALEIIDKKLNRRYLQLIFAYLEEGEKKTARERSKNNRLAFIFYSLIRWLPISVLTISHRLFIMASFPVRFKKITNTKLSKPDFSKSP